jgi:hypothetical protein
MANDTVNLEKAKLSKKDEFYTGYGDIKAELRHYSLDLFTDKTILCNCDDPTMSQFFKYFSDNFERLRLKSLITTCYKSQAKKLFSNGKNKKGAFLIYVGNKNINNNVKQNKVEVHKLNGDGDFRSKECLELLDKSDIVITNPPFSLFRDFITVLSDHQKQFLIIGNVNAISYKQCFTLICEGKMWLGPSIHSGDREFLVPKNYPLDLRGAKKMPNGDTITKSGRIDKDGNKFIRVKGVRWFTNLEFDIRHKNLHLTAKYSKERYPVYDNIPYAINVNRVRDIPKDYFGIMGVPITFLDHYNPDQFKIIGNEYSLGVKGGRGYINGHRMYSRIFIKRKNG